VADAGLLTVDAAALECIAGGKGTDHFSSLEKNVICPELNLTETDTYRGVNVIA
jgi:hypothetical protein